MVHPAHARDGTSHDPRFDTKTPSLDPNKVGKCIIHPIKIHGLQEFSSKAVMLQKYIQKCIKNETKHTLN